MEIVEDQFGSWEGSSTILCLAGLVYNWLTALEKFGIVVCMFLLDFRKAFDRVDHKNQNMV